MTVDDKSFQHFAASNQAKARDWVNQVKEVTGECYFKTYSIFYLLASFIKSDISGFYMFSS